MIRGVSQRIGRLFGRSSGVKVPVARLRLDGPIMPPQGGGGMSRGRITVPEIEKQVRTVQKMYHISRENGKYISVLCSVPVLAHGTWSFLGDFWEMS